MNLITRVVRVLRRAFDAAGGSPRWPAGATMFAPTRQALAARHQLSSRSSYLVNNSPTAHAIEEEWACNIVGDGPSARSGHADEATRRRLESRWTEFFAVADIEGGDLVEFLKRVVRTVVTSGEAFIRLLTTAEGALRLQLLSSEQVNPMLNLELADGGRIIAGIELGPNGERRAYHVFPQPPDTWTVTMIGPAVRIDASDICHVFEPRHAGQVRGLSWLTPVATRLLELDRLEDSLLARMRVAALFAGFVVDADGTSGFGDGKTDPQELSMEPGTLRVLPPGTSVEFPDVPGIEGAPQLLKHMLRSIASGCGVPFELMASDLADVNYSSAKLGLESFRRRVKAIQSSMLGARLLVPVWRRLIALEIMSGRFQAPGFVRDATSYFAVTFLWPQWASLDPLKEAEADQILLANAIKSRQQIVAERGRDYADVEAENTADPRPLPNIRPISAAQPGGATP
jgi:lambda family phage portal protein